MSLAQIVKLVSRIGGLANVSSPPAVHAHATKVQRRTLGSPSSMSSPPVDLPKLGRPRCSVDLESAGRTSAVKTVGSVHF